MLLYAIGNKNANKNAMVAVVIIFLYFLIAIYCHSGGLSFFTDLKRRTGRPLYLRSFCPQKQVQMNPREQMEIQILGIVRSNLQLSFSWDTCIIHHPSLEVYCTQSL